MTDCIFCKIVKGEIPCYKVYEDQDFLAFLDIKPLSQGHTLVIPKNHFRWVQEVEPFEKYWLAAQRVALAMTRGLGSNRVNYITLGDAISHAHIHIVPRFPEDELGEMPDWSKDKKFTPDEMKETAEKLFSFCK